jgi:hypothetical protein
MNKQTGLTQKNEAPDNGSSMLRIAHHCNWSWHKKRF